jgi:hypothetical protein
MGVLCLLDPALAREKAGGSSLPAEAKRKRVEIDY